MLKADNRGAHSDVQPEPASLVIVGDSYFDLILRFNMQ